jgi:hypothetical protein
MDTRAKVRGTADTEVSEGIVELQDLMASIVDGRINFSSGYATNFSKVVTARDRRVLVVAKRGDVRMLRGGILLGPSDFRPSECTFSGKEGVAEGCEKDAKMDVIKSPLAIVVGAASADRMFVRADLHEALLALLATRTLGACPYFSAHLRGVRMGAGEKPTRLTFRNIASATTAEELVCTSTAENMRSALALVAHALWLAQQALGLKHLDMHPENIIWRAAPANYRRAVLLHWEEAGEHLAIPLPKNALGAYIIPTVIDFGLSSAVWKFVRIRRLDYSLLESYNAPRRWGRNTQALGGEEGYDIVTYVEGLMTLGADMRPMPMQCLNELDVAFKIMGAPSISKNGRPRTAVTKGPHKFISELCAASPAWKIASSGVQDTDMALDASGSILHSEPLAAALAQTKRPTPAPIVSFTSYESEPDSGSESESDSENDSNDSDASSASGSASEEEESNDDNMSL